MIDNVIEFAKVLRKQWVALVGPCGELVKSLDAAIAEYESTRADNILRDHIDRMDLPVTQSPSLTLPHDGKRLCHLCREALESAIAASQAESDRWRKKYEIAERELYEARAEVAALKARLNENL